MTSTSMRRMGVTLAALLITTAACDDTVLQPTFGSACRVGSLSAGSDITDSFDRDNCVLDYHFYSGNSVAYVSYSVNLTKGKGYHFYAAATPDENGNRSGQRLIALFGKDANGQSVPLNISDGDAGGPVNASEFFFVAPRSGSFNLVVSNYDVNNLGGYRVTMDECPVLGTITTAGTFDYQMPTSSCIRRSMAYNGVASPIALIGIEVQPNLYHNATVTSTAFTPYFELGGPDFDVFDYLYDDAEYSSNVGSGSTVSVTMNPGTSGLLTLAVGSNFLDPSGEFTVNFTRTAILLMENPMSVRTQQPIRPNLGLTRPTF